MVSSGDLVLTPIRTTSRVLRSGERAEYRLTPHGSYCAGGLRGHRRRVVRAFDGTDWIDERDLFRDALVDLESDRHRRRHLQLLVQEGILDRRHDFERGILTTVAPSAAGYARMGFGRLLLPLADAIVHHLLTVEAGLGMLRDTSIGGPDGGEFLAFRWDEQLRSAARKGVNFAALRGQRVGGYPDAELWVAGRGATESTPVCIPLEVLTSDYKDATLLQKTNELPSSTRFFVETEEMLERTFTVTGTRPVLLMGALARVASLGR